MGTLRHDIRYAIGAGGEKLQQFLEKARSKAGLTGTDDEIIFQIESWTVPEEEKGLFSGEYFPGVFCDIEGCLLRDDGINEQLAEELKKLEEAGQPITLWTGGDIKVLGQRAQSAKLPWKVVSKWTLVDSRVETVFDDETKDEFTEKYRISFEHFSQVE